MFTVNPGSDKLSIRTGISNMFSRRFQKCQQIPGSTAPFAKKGCVGFFLGGGTATPTFVSFGQPQFLASFCPPHPFGERRNRVLSEAEEYQQGFWMRNPSPIHAQFLLLWGSQGCSPCPYICPYIPAPVTPHFWLGTQLF